MKARELRELDMEELGGRLKGARRELYELRFKLAVGQLDNHREIRKARKEIARILSVVHQRRLEGEPEGAGEAIEPRPAAAAEAPETEAAEGASAGVEAPDTAAEAGDETEAAEPEPVAEADEPKARGGRRAAGEDEE
jgi:large subunit ribosomal protein L29